NAADAALEGAQVAAFDPAGDAASMKPWVRLEIREQAQRVLLSVTDSGPGESKQVRERLFEPFFTTKRIGDGMGLGLSVAKGIAQSHGGDLELDERAEQTRFSLWLPVNPLSSGLRTANPEISPCSTQTLRQDPVATTPRL